MCWIDSGGGILMERFLVIVKKFHRSRLGLMILFSSIMIFGKAPICLAEGEHVAGESQRRTFKMHMMICLSPSLKVINQHIEEFLKTEGIKKENLGVMHNDENIFHKFPGWRGNLHYWYILALHQYLSEGRYYYSLVFDSHDKCIDQFRQLYKSQKSIVEDSIAIEDQQTKIKKITPRVVSLVRKSFFMMELSYEVRKINNPIFDTDGYIASFWGPIYEIDEKLEPTILLELVEGRAGKSGKFGKIINAIFSNPSRYLALNFGVQSFLDELGSYERLALQSPISRGGLRRVTIGLNDSDGLNNDQYMETIQFDKDDNEQKIGMVRVNTVGEGLEPSYATVLSGPGMGTEGLLLREVYTPANSFVLDFGFTQYRRKEGYFLGFDLPMKHVSISDVDGFVPLLQCSYERDMGKWFGISDLASILQFSYLLAPGEITTYWGGLGIKKRIYFRRLAVFIRGLFISSVSSYSDPDVSNYHDSEWLKDNEDLYEYDAWQFGLMGDVGVHWWLSRFAFINLKVGYMDIGKLQETDFYNGDGKKLDGDLEVKLNGLHFFGGVSFNL